MFMETAAGGFGGKELLKLKKEEVIDYVFDV